MASGASSERKSLWSVAGPIADELAEDSPATEGVAGSGADNCRWRRLEGLIWERRSAWVQGGEVGNQAC
jgi:hypothetical protein